MPTITMKFEMSEAQLSVVETLRGPIPREQFLRLALQLGLCDFQDDSCRVAKDAIYQTVGALNANYEHARRSRNIDAPDAVATPATTQPRLATQP